MSENIKILIVDDEEDIVEILKYNLEKEGYEIETAFDGLEAIEKAESFEPNLIILDIMMPKMDGIEVCEKLRADKKFENTVIAFLTARSESFTQITALEMGGDDFINKPIKPSVLRARVKALLRRFIGGSDDKDAELTVFGELEIFPEEFKIRISGDEMILAKKEFDLLMLLVSKPGKVFKRSEILKKVWGNDVIVGDRTIDVHIRKLREKIGNHFIYTLKGVGYKFDF
jgi:two-component system alkaline phosphatase synthesis response regulator PhoP